MITETAGAVSSDPGGGTALLMVAVLVAVLGAATGITWPMLRIRPSGKTLFAVAAELVVATIVLLLVYLSSPTAMWGMAALFGIVAVQTGRWILRAHHAAQERERQRTEAQHVCTTCKHPTTPKQRKSSAAAAK